MIRTLVDASLDASCVVDRELRVLHVNSSYVRLSGLKHRDLRRSEMTGLCHNHFQLESCQDGGCIALRAFRNARPYRVDEVYSRRNDLCLIVVAIPLLDDAGEAYAVLEQYRDVTAESRMQANYKQLLDLQRRQNELLQTEVRRQTRQLEETNRELQEALRRVEQLAQTDGLTQLVNRRHFDELFHREVQQAKNRSRTLSLIVFDLDHFKHINDEYGHVTGDTVLQRFAEVLQQCARSTDVVARIGGEEFTVLLPGATAADALRYYERVRRRLAELAFLTTTSAGVASLPQDGVSEIELFECADLALYAAKAAGRDRVMAATDVDRAPMAHSA